ncbi:MAG: VWA domain-containing protein [Acidobacteriia bacterium]|nr:VWA domain-containing protein [Terriglobia bacterium]
MPMSRWPASVFLAALACASALAQQTPVFTSEVNLVRVIATIKNQAGELVGSLQKGDFEVFDNGVRQEVAHFERQTEQPLSIALLIDVSGSTAKDLKFETDSAARFLRALLAEGNPDDAVALYTFNYAVTLQQSFTHNYRRLEDKFKLLKGEAGTALYDAVYYAAQELENREGRKVIVVVTDGGDTTHSTLDSALRATQLADAVIYPVVVVPITNDAGRNIGGEHALQFMAERTGGRTFLPTLGAQLDRAFADIITELRTQYLLGFYPHGVPLTKDPFHKLEVRVKSPDLRVSARNGYYGEAERGAGRSDARTAVTPDGRKKRPNQ